VSQTIIFVAPYALNNFVIVIPAAPAPLITILTFSIYFLATLRALINAARVTIAVPC